MIFLRILGALPRAGMYCPFRAGRAMREVVEFAGGYGFCDHGVDAKEWLKGGYCFSVPGEVLNDTVNKAHDKAHDKEQVFCETMKKRGECYAPIYCLPLT